MQRCYNGVRLLECGPSLKNIDKLDSGAMPMIQSMAATGLEVDLAHFAKLDIELTRDMEQAVEDIKTLTGYYINPGSGDQVAKLLFKDLGLKQARLKMTKSEKRESTEEEVLTAIQHEHPCIPRILDYKELDKLRGTYVRPMPRLASKVGPGEWRMFPHFNTTRVPSGRLSCKDPNLLAMPSRTERGRDIRRGFITRPGWRFVSVDESQIEVRLAAHCSGDKNLIRVYQNEEDIYSDFAITAFKIPDKRFKNTEGKWEYPGVLKMEQRYPAKTCILASIYSVSPGGLLEQMPVMCANCNLEASKHTCGKFRALWTENKCEDLINAFYLKYPGVLKDRKRYHKIALAKGYIYEMWGRILHVQAVRSIHPWVVEAALREVANFPYQAGAQGTIKLTMAAVYDDLENGGMLELCRPLLQVHDELVFECREDLVEELIELVRYRFETCVRLKVPVKAEGVSADTWGDLPK